MPVRSKGAPGRRAGAPSAMRRAQHEKSDETLQFLLGVPATRVAGAARRPGAPQAPTSAVPRRHSRCCMPRWPLRRGDSLLIAAAARVPCLLPPGRRRQPGPTSMKTGDAQASVVCPRALRALGAKGAPCHTTAGRATRHCAARAVAASYTPSARRSTHTAYAAAAAAAQRCAAAARCSVLVVAAAGISAWTALRLGRYAKAAATTRRARACRCTRGAPRVRRPTGAFGDRRTRRNAAFLLW